MTQTIDPTATATATATAADTGPQARAETWLSGFEDALRARDVDRAAGMFAATSFWRDLISFSWNITTVENPAGVAELLTDTLERTDPSGFATSEPADEADGVTTAWFTFETAVGRGRGLLRLVEEDGVPRAWTFLTTMYELKGHEEPRGDRRPQGAEHGADKHRTTWLEHRQAEAESLGSTTQPYVLVVGGGQGGIALGARLRQLGVPSLVIDKHARPGDQWRNRYKSLCLHDPVWYDHLPYLKFPDNWPVFAPKDKIGDWLESYAKVMEVPYWSSTVATTAQPTTTGRPASGRSRWSARASHSRCDPRTWCWPPACPASPTSRTLPGQDVFRGDQHHSSAHPGPDAYAGKRCVVIGSNNSAFDICGALWENDADVTMVQRSSTHIVKSRQPDGHRAGRPLLRAGGRRRA